MKKLKSILFICLVLLASGVLAQSNVKEVSALSGATSTPLQVLQSDTTAAISEPEILFEVHVRAEFPEGLYALYRFLADNIQYPVEATDKGIQGKVVLRFVVKKDGSIEDIKAMSEVGGGCTEEAIRVIKLMPKWIPAEHNGKKVPSYYTLPITFKLQEKE